MNNMVLSNKLCIENQAELNKLEEKISKQKAKQLFDTGEIDNIPIGTFFGTVALRKAEDRHSRDLI